MSASDRDSARRVEIVRLAGALNERLVAIRRDIHAHPEIGHHEHRTTALIVDQLERAGLGRQGASDWYRSLLRCVAGRLRRLLRFGRTARRHRCADRSPTARTVDYASKSPRNVPRLRARCAHRDSARGRHRVGPTPRPRPVARGVRLIFQPAEETSPGGALDAIEGGVLHDLTEIYALHCDPRTDVGQIALKVGPITSAVDQVNIVLSGAGGHTSRPQLTQDVIGALGALATMTQLLLSRRIDPRSGVSLMWGSIHSGSVANAIPRTGEIVGTLRALDAAGWQLAKQLIPELAAEIVRPFGVEVDVAVTDGVPPAVNHARGVRRLTRAAEEMLGPGSRGGDRAVPRRRGLLLDAAAGSRCSGASRRTNPR